MRFQRVFCVRTKRQAAGENAFRAAVQADIEVLFPAFELRIIFADRIRPRMLNSRARRACRSALFQACSMTDCFLLQQLLQIFFRCADRGDAEVLHQVIQHIRGNERRERGPEADILDSQIQQRQQDTDRLLFVPGKHH